MTIDRLKDVVFSIIVLMLLWMSTAVYCTIVGEAVPSINLATLVPKIIDKLIE